MITFLTWWGFCLSNLLALIELWELWRNWRDRQ